MSEKGRTEKSRESLIGEGGGWLPKDGKACWEKKIVNSTTRGGKRQPRGGNPIATGSKRSSINRYRRKECSEKRKIKGSTRDSGPKELFQEVSNLSLLCLKPEGSGKCRSLGRKKVFIRRQNSIRSSSKKQGRASGGRGKRNLKEV